MQEQIRQAIAAHLHRRAVEVRLHTTWVRQVYDVLLDDGSRVWVKLTQHEDWIDTSGHEARVSEMLRQRGLELPQVLAVDQTRQIVPYPLVIVAHAGGERLGDLLRRASEAEARAICRCVGDFYGRMHRIHGPRSGVWVNDPALTLLVSPHEHMYRAEIVAGSGARALTEGLISAATYERLVRLWGAALPWLKQHTPTLVHYSAFPWSIYLAQGAEGWRITKLTALGDALWWDPACDLAMLRWPPCLSSDLLRWDALIQGYGAAGGQPPDPQRLRHYLLLQRLCAAMGTYMAPSTYACPRWTRLALGELDPIMDAIESHA